LAFAPALDLGAVTAHAAQGDSEHKKERDAVHLGIIG